MISLSEQNEVYSYINHEIQEKSSSLLEAIVENGPALKGSEFSQAENSGISTDRIYFVVDGHVSVEYQTKELFLYQAGDVISHPSIDDFEDSGIYYSARTSVTLKSLSSDEFFDWLSSSKENLKLWFSIYSLSQLQLKQIIGVLTQKEEQSNPGFMRYKAGATIINEGDDAEYVYSISEGSAIACHNGVEVGIIKTDEIFGAIAVLTHQKRTATVKAKTDCTVLMVHKDEFSQMIHSHPKLFLNILASLADKIVSLNRKISG